MALLKCDDCGREVSSRAAACPHCGCPVSSGAPPTAVAASRLNQERRPNTTSSKPSDSSAAAVPLIALAIFFVVIVAIFRACSVSNESVREDSALNTGEAAAAPQSVVPVGPTEADKVRWSDALTNDTASASYREQMARKLIEHFPDTNEGKEAASMLPELEKATAYEAKGRQWSYDSREEGMSGKSVRTATVRSTNLISLGFPYEGPQRATLQLRRHPRWGNDVIFSIEQGQLLCHSYGDCTIGVKFDDGSVLRYDGTPPADNSTEVAFIPAFSAFMKRLPKTEKVKIEVSIYQGGNQVFEFDVSGFKPEKFK